MFVDRSMTQKVITATADTSIFEAREMMAQNRIRHLPVVQQDGLLVGMITDRDIRSALPRDLFHNPVIGPEREKYENLKVRDIMSSDLLTISPTDTLQDALLLIEKKKVGALPVVDDKGRLRGIISVRDLLRAFINVLGIGQPGTLLGILVEERVGQLKKIVDAITEEGVSFGSVLVARYWDKDKRAVFPYLLTQNVSRVKKKLKDMGYTLLDPMDWYLDQLPKND
jgi:acetoin utilization protein AcuB